MSEKFYKTKAWKYQSRMVLIANSYESSMGRVCKCSTCPRILPINSKNMHCGHYKKVSDGNNSQMNTALTWKNLAPQCDNCNWRMGGRQDLMREWLVRKYGEDEVKKVEITAKTALHSWKIEHSLYESELEKRYNDMITEIGYDPWKK